jgi:hypothetical protein
MMPNGANWETLFAATAWWKPVPGRSFRPGLWFGTWIPSSRLGKKSDCALMDKWASVESTRRRTGMTVEMPVT